MSILVKKGELLRLNYQLTDGDILLPIVVKAFLRDPTGTILAGLSSGVILTHVGLGQFKDFSVQMPDVDEVTATYVPYESDGVTVSIDYGYGLDVFTESSNVIPDAEGLDMADILKLSTAMSSALDIVVATSNEEPIDIVIEDESTPIEVIIGDV